MVIRLNGKEIIKLNKQLIEALERNTESRPGPAPTFLADTYKLIIEDDGSCYLYYGDKRI